MKIRFIGRYHFKIETTKSKGEIESLIKGYSYNSTNLIGTILTTNKFEFSSIGINYFTIPNAPNFEIKIVVKDGVKNRIIESTLKGNEVYEIFMILGLAFVPVLLVLIINRSIGFEMLILQAVAYILMYKLNSIYVKKGLEDLVEIHKLLAN